MKLKANSFESDVLASLQNAQLRNNLSEAIHKLKLLRQKGAESLENFEELTECASTIKSHTIEHLGVNINRFEAQVLKRGGQVYFAKTCQDLNGIVLEICKRANAKSIVKGKSMVSEETGLNRALMDAGLDVVETDLGEYIVQIANERPSHILGPAMHKSKNEIIELFYENHDLGPRSLEDISDIVAEARLVLREKFLAADVGITGANALIAETGSVVLVTNEGNGDLCSCLPRIHIVVSGIEKLVPELDDAGAILRVLGRSITGQSMSSYTSIFSGPGSMKEGDGPEEFYVVLLDNHRTDIIKSEYRDILRCIRCSACINHCPVFGQIGGHAYGAVYMGPMGSVLTPLMESLIKAKELPNACCGCRQCAEVCPMHIPLPELLRNLRKKEHEMRLSKRSLRWGMTGYMQFARSDMLYDLFTSLFLKMLSFISKSSLMKKYLFSSNRWMNTRCGPFFEGHSFKHLLRRQNRSKERHY